MVPRKNCRLFKPEIVKRWVWVIAAWSLHWIYEFWALVNAQTSVASLWNLKNVLFFEREIIASLVVKDILDNLVWELPLEGLWDCRG
jgi:hypothetical protein